VSDSAIYWGRVTHRRFLPREHAFDYRVIMFEMFLDELDDLARDVKGLVLEGRVTAYPQRSRAASRLPGRYVLRRRDFLPGYEGTLDNAARTMYRDLVGSEAPGASRCSRTWRRSVGTSIPSRSISSTTQGAWCARSPR